MNRGADISAVLPVAAADEGDKVRRVIIKSSPIAILPIRMHRRRGPDRPPMAQPIYSHEEFDLLIKGRTLYHIRSSIKVQAVDASTGKTTTSWLPEESISIILNLHAALAAATQEGTYLAIRDPCSFIVDYDDYDDL